MTYAVSWVLAVVHLLSQHDRMSPDDVEAIRSAMLAQRRALSPGVVARNSATVVQRIRSLPEIRGLAADEVIGAYLGVRGEIDPSALVHDPWLQVALPVTTPGEPLRFLVPEGPLVDGPFGIRQPERGVEVAPMSLGVVVVPLVAADRSGNRVGHGAGFYDRTFAGRPPGTGPLLIGVCHEMQVVECLDARPWDVPLDLLVTEVGLIRT